MDELTSQPAIVVDGPRILVTACVQGCTITIAKRNLEHFDAQDPYFFDSDYTIAGSTGFLLWEANWLLLRLLNTPALPASPSPSPTTPSPAATPTSPPGPSAAPAQTPQPSGGLAALLAGRRVLDLGSGTGLAGLCAAACGAHVLLSDLASVCAGSLQANLQRNAVAGASSSQSPADDNTTTLASVASAGAPLQNDDGRGPWAGAVRVGRGTASVMALDWTEPLEPQVAAGGNDPRDADFILAVDTIWLMDIFQCFIDLVIAVLSHDPRVATGGQQGGRTAATTGAGAGSITELSPGACQQQDSSSTVDAGVCGVGRNNRSGCFPTTTPVPGPHQQQHQQHQQQRACYLAFVERAGAESKLFVRKEAVEAELRARGCAVEVMVAEDVDVDGVARPGRVLRVTLAKEDGSSQ